MQSPTSVHPSEHHTLRTVEQSIQELTLQELLTAAYFANNVHTKEVLQAVCFHPEFLSVVRRVVCPRLARWSYPVSLADAEQTLIADFLARRRFSFLAEVAATNSDHNFRVGLRCCLDNHARHLFAAEFSVQFRRNRRVMRHIYETDLSKTVDENSDSRWTLEDESLLDALRDALLTELDSRELAVITCRFFDSRSIRETARRLGLTEFQIRSTTKAALIKLRRTLAII